MLSIVIGDTIQEVQGSIFNNTNIFVIWKAVYSKTKEAVSIIEQFLKKIKKSHLKKFKLTTYTLINIKYKKIYC